MDVTIIYQTDLTHHTFDVDSYKLSSVELKSMCAKMIEQSVLVNGKYYECRKLSY